MSESKTTIKTTASSDATTRTLAGGGDEAEDSERGDEDKVYDDGWVYGSERDQDQDTD